MNEQDKNVKYLICCEAHIRYLWELEVLLTNLEILAVENVVVLTYGDDYRSLNKLRDKFSFEFHYYEDRRPDKKYKTSIRPWLWWQYLQEKPERCRDRYFYIDSDIILRETIKFAKMEGKNKKWYASDVSSYADPRNLRLATKGKLDEHFATVTGLTPDELYNFKPGEIGGAQWYIVEPTVEFWQNAYGLCEKIYDLFLHTSNIDNKLKWWTDMWVMHWLCRRENIQVEVNAELDFCFPDNPIEKWYQCKILHNTGIASTQTDADLFFDKNAWFDRSPLGSKIEVSNKYCSYVYVKFMEIAYAYNENKK